MFSLNQDEDMSAPTYRVVMDVDCTSPPVTVNHETDPYVSIKHKVYRQSSFYQDYRQPEPEPETTTEKVSRQMRSACSCSAQKGKSLFNSLVPIVKNYRKYKVKTDLPNDVIAGFTVGIMQLPQGM